MRLLSLSMLFLTLDVERKLVFNILLVYSQDSSIKLKLPLDVIAVQHMKFKLLPC